MRCSTALISSRVDADDRPFMRKCIGRFHHGFAIALGQGIDQAEHVGAVHRAQHLAHARFLQLAAAKSNGLVGERERIAHAEPARRARAGAAPGARQARFRWASTRVRWSNTVSGAMGRRLNCRQRAQHRDPAPSADRCVAQQKSESIPWRLLQGLQHGVEAPCWSVCHLVDHEDLEAPLHGSINSLLQQALAPESTPRLEATSSSTV